MNLSRIQGEIVIRRAVLGMLILLALAAALLAPAGAGRAAEGAAPLRDGERQALADLGRQPLAGKPVPLLPLIGREPVILVFWAVWCPLCRAEVPRLNRLHAAARVRVISINVGDSPRKAEAFVAANGVGYPVLLDPDGKGAEAFRLPGVPACLIIGRSGRVVYRGTIVPEAIEDYLER